MAKVPILIVEDELLVAESLRRRLTTLGYPVVGIIATGEEAVQAAVQLQPGLILMDIQLAGMLDGVEAADQIKLQIDVPIIYLTAFSDDVTLQRAKITEPFGYVLKPYDPETLHISIETALYKHSMEKKLRRAYEELEVWVSERTVANRQLKAEIAERIQIEQALRESERKLRQYADEQSLLYAVTAAASAFLDPYELLSRVADVLLEKLAAEQACVVLVEAVAGYASPLVIERGQATNADQPAGESAFAQRCLACITLAPEGTPEVEAQPAAYPKIDESLFFSEQEQEASYAYILLEAGNRTLGLLGLAWDRTRQTVEVKGDLLQTIGRQVGMALRNAQLYQAALQVDGLQVLNAISSAAASSLEAPRILNMILEMTCSAIKVPQGVILARDVATRELSLESMQGENAGRLPHLLLPEGHSVAEWIVSSRQALVVNADQAAMLVDPAAPSAGVGSLVGAPLIYNDEVNGLLLLAHESPDAFNAEAAGLLEAVAAIAAAALANTRLFATIRNRAHELELLNDIGLSLTSTLDYAAVIQGAVLHLKNLFAADRVTVFEVDPASGQLHSIETAQEAHPDAAMGKSVEAGYKLAQWVAENHTSILLEDVYADPRFQLANLPEAPAENCSAMVVPLLCPDRTAGAVLVVKETLRAYTGVELQLLQSIGAMLAVAMENARLYQSLKALLVEREQTQAQLLQTEKIAALGRLAASIAHEINNPLQAVQGCLSLIGEEMAGKQRREKMDRYLQIVNSEIERVIEIVCRMRDFYRPARQVLQPTAVNSVLESVLELSAKKLQHSQVTVERRLADNLPQLLLNPDYLKQVFLNLVLNAIDALPQGGRLLVSTSLDQLQKPDQSMQPAVRIEFSDNGQGMPPDVLSRLFEPFYTTKDQGSGLGLYVSYTIIETFNGKMAATSQEGVGSTFTIQLPISPIPES